jgi:hypothetical protein
MRQIHRPPLRIIKGKAANQLFLIILLLQIAVVTAKVEIGLGIIGVAQRELPTEVHKQVFSSARLGGHARLRNGYTMDEKDSYQ